jgi:hypothetical protein
MKSSFRLILSITFLLMFTQQLANGQPQILTPNDSLIPSAGYTGKTSTGFVPKKFSTNLQIGSFFTTTSGFGSSFSTYISPKVSYALNPKFRVSAGITIINSTLYGVNPWFNSGRENSLNGNFTHAILTISGDYQINNKLILSGYLFKDINLYNTVNTPYSWKPESPQGGFLKVGYQVNDHFHIEGGIGYSKGVDPYRSYYGSPYSPGIFPY